jgi:hypothetical protein
MSGRVSYLGGIVKDGLILDLDAGKLDSYNRLGTTWNDISGNRNNGTLTNFGLQTIWSSNNGGNIIFDGTNDYATVITPNLTTTEKEGSLTYEYWVRPNGTVYGSFSESTIGTQYFTPGTNQGLGGDRNYNYNNLSYRGFQFCLGTNGFIAGLHNNSVAPTFLVDYQSYTGINHLVVIKNTYNCQYYINGVLKKTSLTSGAIIGDSMSTLTSFDGTYFGRYFNGNIYSVKFYKRALTTQEILQNYNALKGRYI